MTEHYCTSYFVSMSLTALETSHQWVAQDLSFVTRFFSWAVSSRSVRAGARARSPLVSKTVFRALVCMSVLLSVVC